MDNLTYEKRLISKAARSHTPINGSFELLLMQHELWHVLRPALASGDGSPGASAFCCGMDFACAPDAEIRHAFPSSDRRRAAPLSRF